MGNSIKLSFDFFAAPREQSSNQSSTKKNKIILFLFDWLDWFAAVLAERWVKWGWMSLFCGGLWAAQPHGNQPQKKRAAPWSPTLSHFSICWRNEANWEKWRRDWFAFLSSSHLSSRGDGCGEAKREERWKEGGTPNRCCSIQSNSNSISFFNFIWFAFISLWEKWNDIITVIWLHEFMNKFTNMKDLWIYE